ncbi:hypothetical protein [Pseudomonas sp.]|uniref:hypothetical protein n=1 Tax=Pseudomonas sp. TaxID=306 RepID=UPI003BB73F85
MATCSAAHIPVCANPRALEQHQYNRTQGIRSFPAGELHTALKARLRDLKPNPKP